MSKSQAGKVKARVAASEEETTFEKFQETEKKEDGCLSSPSLSRQGRFAFVTGRDNLLQNKTK